MRTILIVRHVAHEGPGYLAEYLDHQSVPYRILAVDDGDKLPSTVAEVGGLVFMGGPMSVNDDLPWIEPAVNLISQALAAGVPVLGHCLGGQLMAKALGARVYANPVPEYGWIPVRIADNDIAGQWFDGNTRDALAFHWHGETFDLPHGATHVLSSAFCQNQGFVIGNSLALQCHIEMTPALVRDWVGRTDDATLTPSPSIQGRNDMLNDLDRKISTMQQVADRVYAHWLQGVK